MLAICGENKKVATRKLPRIAMQKADGDNGPEKTIKTSTEEPIVSNEEDKLAPRVDTGVDSKQGGEDTTSASGPNQLRRKNGIKQDESEVGPIMLQGGQNPVPPTERAQSIPLPQPTSAQDCVTSGPSAGEMLQTKTKRKAGDNSTVAQQKSNKRTKEATRRGSLIARALPRTMSKKPPKPARKRRQAKRRSDITLDEKIKHISVCVDQAGALVAQTLCAGSWPSAVRPYHLSSFVEAGRDGVSDSSYEAHKTHLSIVAQSIVQFCRDTVLPSMIASFKSTGRTRQRDSPFVGTLAMIREVLWQNADSIFGMSIASMRDRFAARVLSTTVTLVALESRVSYRSRYLQFIQAYDRGHRAFTNCIGGKTVISSETQTERGLESFRLNARNHPILAPNVDMAAMPDGHQVHVTFLHTNAASTRSDPA